MEACHSFKDLVVWQKAHAFVLSVYKSTQKFPHSEQYGLSSQFQRAAVSIAANIAEGFRKLGISDKLRFMNISQGSLEECRYYIILSRDLNYISAQESDSLNEMIEIVSRMLNAYSQKIKENNL